MKAATAVTSVRIAAGADCWAFISAPCAIDKPNSSVAYSHAYGPASRGILYSDDHDPPHVHVEYGDARCRIELGTLLVKNISMHARDRSSAVRLVAAHLEEPDRAWREFQSRKLDK